MFDQTLTFAVEFSIWLEMCCTHANFQPISQLLSSIKLECCTVVDSVVVCWPWHLLDVLHAFTATKFTLCDGC